MVIVQIQTEEVISAMNLHFLSKMLQPPHKAVNK